MRKTSFCIIFISFSLFVYSQETIDKAYQFLSIEFGSSHQEVREKMFFKFKKTGDLFKGLKSNNYYLQYDTLFINRRKAYVKFSFIEDSLAYISVEIFGNSGDDLYKTIEQYKGINSDFVKIFKTKIIDTEKYNDYKFLINNSTNCDSLSNRLFFFPNSRYILNNRISQFDNAKIELSVSRIVDLQNQPIRCQFFTGLYLYNSKIFTALALRAEYEKSEYILVR